MIQASGLLRAVVMDHLSCFHAVLLCKAVVAAHHVRACFFCAGQHFFVHIRCNPVVAVNKADPFPRCQGKAYVFGTPLFSVYLGMNRTEAAGVFFFKLLKDVPGLIRGAVIHCDDFHVLQRLSHQGIQAVFQFSVCRRIINRHDNTQLHSQFSSLYGSPASGAAPLVT